MIDKEKKELVKDVVTECALEAALVALFNHLVENSTQADADWYPDGWEDLYEE